jgi:hypothetical protein
LNINFSPLHVVQTGSEAHPASYSMGSEGLFPREVKRQRCEADHSPSISTEENTWIYTSTTPYIFVAYYLFILRV